MRRLAATVHVMDPDTGRHVVFHKGSEPPAKIQDLITNPDAWEEEPQQSEVSAEAEPAPAEDKTGEPARSGKGSSRDAWVAFAADHGVHVDDGDSRDDIIAELAQAGVIEE